MGGVGVLGFHVLLGGFVNDNGEVGPGVRGGREGLA